MSARLAVLRCTALAARSTSSLTPLFYTSSVRQLHTRTALAEPVRPTASYASTATAAAASPVTAAPAATHVASPYDKPLSEQAKEVGHDLLDGAKHLAAKAKVVTKQAVEQVSMAATVVKDTAQEKLEQHQQHKEQQQREAALGTPSATYAATGADAVKQQQDDAERARQHANNTLKQAKNTAENAAVDVKETLQSGWHSTKKVARQVKEGVASLASATVPSSDTYVAKEDLPTGTQVKVAKTSTTEVKSSLVEGPQEMPQGVGRRVVLDGKPLETGTRGS